MANASDEDNTRFCDPCNYLGLQKQAAAYCVDCPEYLCDGCMVSHGSLRATRGHNIEHLDDSSNLSIQEKAIISAVMTCSIHPSETLTKYCVEHKHFVCRACLMTKHRKCEANLLKDVVKQQKIIDEENKFTRMTKSLLRDVKEMKDSLEKDKDKLSKNVDKCKDDLKKFKREIISWVEHLEKEMNEQIEENEKEILDKIESNITTLDVLTTQLDDLAKSIETIGNIHEGLFVLMETKKGHVIDASELIEGIKKEIKTPVLNFYRSAKLQNLLSEIKTFGQLITDSSESSKNVFIQKKDWNNYETSAVNFLDIQTISKCEVTNHGSSSVSGCTFLPNGELVICREYSVQLFTSDFNLKFILNTGYLDVSAVSTEKVAVTDKNKKQIQFLNISDTITKGKTIPVGMDCYGIDFKNDRLYVSGVDDWITWKIKVLMMNGDIVNTFNVRHRPPYYIAVNSSSTKIIGCDSSNGVWCTNINGTILYRYSDRELKHSRGVVFDSYDNFMVCGEWSNNVHVVKKDGTKHRTLLTSEDEIYEPWCMAYRESDKTLIVGQSSGQNSLLAFKFN